MPRRFGFGQADRQAGLRFGQSRAARRHAIDFAFSGRVALACRIGLALTIAPLVAGGGFCSRGCGYLGGGGLDRLAPAVEFGAGGLQLRFNIGETIALGEPARRASRRIGGNGKTVPAPQIAFARYEPLARLEQLGEPRAVGTRNKSDLRHAARQFFRRGDVFRKRCNAIRKRRVAARLRTSPVHRRFCIDRRVEIVTERGAERGLISLFDRELVDDRRPQIFGFDVQQLCERLCFRFKPMGSALGIGERLAHNVERLPRRGMRGFGAQRFGFCRGDRVLSCGHRLRGAFEIDGRGGVFRRDWICQSRRSSTRAQAACAARHIRGPPVRAACAAR